MITPKRNEPKPFVHSNENHRTAMRAMVDKLISDDFRNFSDHRIYFDVVGCYQDGEYKMLTDRDYDYGCEPDLSGTHDCKYDGEPNHVVIRAKINQEVVDEYRNFNNVFEDPDETGIIEYPPIELFVASRFSLSWAVRVMANELIKNNFDATSFRTDIDYPFSMTVEHDTRSSPCRGL